MTMSSIHPERFESCVMVFVRAPETGKVKTRLTGLLAPGIVLNLYKCFVSDILDMLMTDRYSVRICYAPANASDAVTGWLGSGYEYRPQRGNDIGDRMRNAFHDVFADGFHRALLIGSDIPGLEAPIVDQASRALLRTDAVIGPAADGGYYLIGFNTGAFEPDIFEAMPWSTSEVFAETLNRLSACRRSVHILPVCQDIDTLDDLESFIRCRSLRNPDESRTLKYLKRIGFPAPGFRAEYPANPADHDDLI